MPTAPRPTIRELAAATGFSRSTVSAALQNRPDIAPATRRKIQRKAKAMGYRPDAKLSELMEYLSSSKRRPDPTPLLWITAEERRKAWQTFPWYKTIYRGAEREATRQGYRLESFWLNEPGLSPKRALQILRTRGIRGAIISQTSILESLTPADLDFMTCVQLQMYTFEHPFHIACPNYFYNMSLAFASLRELGYQRPSLALHDGMEPRAVDCYTGAYLRAHMALPKRDQTPVLHYQFFHPKKQQQLRKWIERYQPDAIITNDQNFTKHLEEDGLRVPEDIGVVHMNLADDVKGWSGIDQNQDVVGAACIHMLIAELRTYNQGRPEFPHSYQVKGSWIAGETTRQRDATPN